MENITKDVWMSVHSNLGMSIYSDIQKIDTKLTNKDVIQKKMEKLTDSLIGSILNKNDKSDKSFIDEYNSNPKMFRDVIIEEYKREYENKFPPLYDFNQEMNSHKDNVKNILKRIQSRKGKTKEEYDSIEFIKDYLGSLK